MEQTFKVGDLVRAKPGRARSNVSSDFNVASGQIYKIMRVADDGGLVLQGGPDKGAAASRFELVYRKGDSPLYGYLWLTGPYAGGASLYGARTPQKAIEQATQELSNGNMFRVIEYRYMDAYTVCTETKAVPADQQGGEPA